MTPEIAALVERLEGRAESAKGVPGDLWFSAESLVVHSDFAPDDAAYIAACSPDAVLALCKALREADERAVSSISRLELATRAVIAGYGWSHYAQKPDFAAIAARVVSEAEGK